MNAPIIPHNTNSHIPRRRNSPPGQRDQTRFQLPRLLINNNLLEQFQILNALTRQRPNNGPNRLLPAFTRFKSV